MSTRLSVPTDTGQVLIVPVPVSVRRRTRMTSQQKILWGTAIALGALVSAMPALKLYDLVKEKLSGSVRVHGELK